MLDNNVNVNTEERKKPSYRIEAIQNAVNESRQRNSVTTAMEVKLSKRNSDAAKAPLKKFKDNVKENGILFMTKEGLMTAAGKTRDFIGNKMLRLRESLSVRLGRLKRVTSAMYQAGRNARQVEKAGINMEKLQKKADKKGLSISWGDPSVAIYDVNHYLETGERLRRQVTVDLASTNWAKSRAKYDDKWDARIDKLNERDEKREEKRSARFAKHAMKRDMAYEDNEASEDFENQNAGGNEPVQEQPVRKQKAEKDDYNKKLRHELEGYVKANQSLYEKLEELTRKLADQQTMINNLVAEKTLLEEAIDGKYPRVLRRSALSEEQKGDAEEPAKAENGNRKNAFQKFSDNILELSQARLNKAAAKSKAKQAEEEAPVLNAQSGQGKNPAKSEESGMDYLGEPLDEEDVYDGFHEHTNFSDIQHEEDDELGIINNMTYNK